jgi:phosphatidylinositol alpha 1,6-mannosyltransferase
MLVSVKPTRIALVSDTFAPHRDDRALTARHIADRLIDLGCDVEILTASPGTPTYRGAPVHRIAGHRHRGRRIAEVMRDFAPDLMQAISPDEFGRKALKQALRSDTPTVVLEQEPVPSYLPASYVEQVIGRADRYLVSAPWSVRLLAERGIRAYVWEPGVDTDAFAPRLRDGHLHRQWAGGGADGQAGLVVGYVGGLHKRHGVRRLAELADVAGVRLIVVGTGPQAAWLGDRLPRAKFLAPMTSGDLGTAIASLDVLVDPSPQRTCGHALRAAAACGIPVVASRHGAAAEIVDDGGTGLLYDPGEPGALGRAVAALGEPAVRVRLGTAARARVERRDWTRAVDELLAEHYQAARSRRGLTGTGRTEHRTEERTQAGARTPSLTEAANLPIGPHFGGQPAA